MRMFVYIELKPHTLWSGWFVKMTTTPVSPIVGYCFDPNNIILYIVKKQYLIKLNASLAF